MCACAYPEDAACSVGQKGTDVSIKQNNYVHVPAVPQLKYYASYLTLSAISHRTLDKTSQTLHVRIIDK